MDEVARHYEGLLAARYTWSLGGSAPALVEEARALLAQHLGPVSLKGGPALDLGCGPGQHSLALAALGFDPVTAVDSSPTLLAELQLHARDVPTVRAVAADLTAGLAGLVDPGTAAVALCMGDTVGHLPDRAAVARLLADVRVALRPGGRLVLTLRDLTRTLEGHERFLPVRSDDEALLTCFLEDEGDRVRVHDLLHERLPDGSWRLRVSSYRKLRLGPDEVAELCTGAGLTVSEVVPLPRGLWLVAADLLT